VSLPPVRYAFSIETPACSSSFRFAFQDREGNIWAGTNGSGLFRLKTRRFLSWGEAEGLPDVRITSLSRSPQGDLLIASYRKRM
jgi:ligand-binding sensor domain-containing protein